MERGTGRTTKQMKDAPFGCFYAVSNDNDKFYTERLAYDIGRGDLNIIVLDRHTDFHRFRGSRRGILLDHYVAETISPRLRDEVRMHNNTVERRIKK